MEIETEEKAIWDPLWEFILDDRDEPVRRGFRPYRRQEAPSPEENAGRIIPSILDLEDFQADSTSSNQKSHKATNDESSSNDKKVRRSSSLKKNKTKEANDVDNSSWSLGTPSKDDKSRRSSSLGRKKRNETNDEDNSSWGWGSSSKDENVRKSSSFLKKGRKETNDNGNSSWALGYPSMDEKSRRSSSSGRKKRNETNNEENTSWGWGSSSKDEKVGKSSSFLRKSRKQANEEETSWGWASSSKEEKNHRSTSSHKKSHKQKNDEDKTSWGWGSAKDENSKDSSKRHPWRRNQQLPKSESSENWKGLFSQEEDSVTNQNAQTMRRTLEKKGKGSTRNDQAKESKKGLLRRRLRKNENAPESREENLAPNHNIIEQLSGFGSERDMPELLPEESIATNHQGLFAQLNIFGSDRETSGADSQERIVSEGSEQITFPGLLGQLGIFGSDGDKAEPVTRERKEPDESIQKRPDTSSRFDPFAALFDVAGKLDPWGSDGEDSDTNSYVSRTDDATDDETVHTGNSTAERIDQGQNEQSLRQEESVTQEKSRSLEEPQSKEEPRSLEEPRPPEPVDGFNEIRVFHSPIIYANNSDLIQNEEHRIEDDTEFQIQEQGLVRNNGSKDHWPEEEPIEYSGGSSRSSRVESAARKIPPRDIQRTFSAANKLELERRLRDDSCEKKHGLQRVVCCSVKNSKSPIVDQLDLEDVNQIFPASRIVSEDASKSIYKQKADFVNGVMGMPSDTFAMTKGPQSLYAYDYESKLHMDLIYAEHGRKPTSTLFVRKLGIPPEIHPLHEGDDIIIQVEASTVSTTDCLVCKGKWWGDGVAPLPNTPGAEVVGKVYRIKQNTAKKHDLQPRDTVLSLVKWGGNTRYMTIDAKKVVKIPNTIDPAQAVCLPETYLAAFQVLHFGQSGEIRYITSSLKGKSILVVGAMASNMGKAIIELALDAGVANIYATAKKKHWKTLISMGVMPLTPDPADWISRIEGVIDLVLATNGELREDVTLLHYQTLRPHSGHLILCGHRPESNDMKVGDWQKQQTTVVCSKNKVMTRMMNRTHSYDVYEQWETRLELCKRDLRHVVALLSKGVIKPYVLDRLSLGKVPRAHELLDSKKISGFLVCEPWMKGKKRAVYL